MSEIPKNIFQTHKSMKYVFIIFIKILFNIYLQDKMKMVGAKNVILNYYKL